MQNKDNRQLNPITADFITFDINKDLCDTKNQVLLEGLSYTPTLDDLPPVWGTSVRFTDQHGTERVGRIVHTCFTDKDCQLYHVQVITQEDSHVAIHAEGDSGGLVTKMPDVQGDEARRVLKVEGLVLGMYTRHGLTMTVANRLPDALKAIGSQRWNFYDGQAD